MSIKSDLEKLILYHSGNYLETALRALRLLAADKTPVLPKTPGQARTLLEPALVTAPPDAASGDDDPSVAPLNASVSPLHQPATFGANADTPSPATISGRRK